MQRLVVPDRSLEVLEQVAEDRTHGLHDLLGILAGGRLLLELVRFGIPELERAGDRFGEVGAAEREGSNPAATAVSDHHVRRVGADVEVDDRFFALGQIVVE